MTLEQLNSRRADLDLEALSELPDLDSHCESCGESLSTGEDEGFTSLDGGRCLVCFHMICGIAPE